MTVSRREPPTDREGPLLPLPRALGLSLIPPSIGSVFWKLRNQHRTSEQVAISNFAKFLMKGTGG